MDSVYLKYNTIKSSMPLVTATMLSLALLLAKQPIHFYELVMKCRDENHQIFGNLIEPELKKLMLLQADGIPHRAIKEIVLSAVVGEGLEMTLQSPIQH